MKHKLHKLAQVFCFAFSLLFILSSCEGPAGRDGYDGRDGKDGYNGRDGQDGKDGKDGLANWSIVNITIKEGEWKWDATKKLYYATVDLPELTEYIYNNGSIVSYVYIGTQGQDEVMYLLKYDDYVSGYKFSIWNDYSYDMGPSAQFYFKWSDGSQSKPGNYNFKIVLMW